MNLREEIDKLFDHARDGVGKYTPTHDAHLGGFLTALRTVKGLLDAHPPTGYDVYCAQDAPTFAHWERVAWFAVSAGAVRYVDEEVGYSEVGEWDDETRALMVWGERPSSGKGRTIVRRYRILPAGSPAPEDGAL